MTGAHAGNDTGRAYRPCIKVDVHACTRQTGLMGPFASFHPFTSCPRWLLSAKQSLCPRRARQVISQGSALSIVDSNYTGPLYIYIRSRSLILLQSNSVRPLRSIAVSRDSYSRQPSIIWLSLSLLFHCRFVIFVYFACERKSRIDCAGQRAGIQRWKGR